MYFTRVTTNLIVNSDGSLDGNEEDATFDLDKEDSIVSIEFLDASDCFSCHFLDTPLSVDNKPYVFIIYLSLVQHLCINLDLFPSLATVMHNRMGCL